jgi:hypothetical protein
MKPRVKAGPVAYLRRPNTLIWLYMYGLLLVCFYLLLSYHLPKSVNPTNGDQPVGQTVDGTEQRVDLQKILLSAQEMHKERRVVKRLKEPKGAAHVTLYQKRTLKILVCFPNSRPE